LDEAHVVAALTVCRQPFLILGHSLTPATGPINATKEIPVRAANPDLWEQFQILGHAGNRHGIGKKAYHSIHLGWDALLLRPGFGTEKNRLAVERNDPSADEVRLG
jgi:hypothetical protein